VPERDRPEGYLGRVLADGAAPFPHRAGVARLLGLADDDGPLEVRLRSAASFGFSAVAGFFSFPSDDLERDVLVATGPRPTREPDAGRPARRERPSPALRPAHASIRGPASEEPHPVPGHATTEAPPPALVPPVPVVPEPPPGAPDGDPLAVTVSPAPPDHRPAPEPGPSRSVPCAPTDLPTAPTGLPTGLLPPPVRAPSTGRTARQPVTAGDVGNAPDPGDGDTPTGAPTLIRPRRPIVRHELRIPPAPATAVPPSTPVGPRAAAAAGTPVPPPAVVVPGAPSGPTAPQPAASPPEHVPDVPDVGARAHPGPRASALHSGQAEAPRRPDPPTSGTPAPPPPERDLPTAAPTRRAPRPQAPGPTAPGPTAPGPTAPAHPATVPPAVAPPPPAAAVLVTPPARGTRAAFWERRYLGQLRCRVWR
jgi:hypothetical protein